MHVLLCAALGWVVVLARKTMAISVTQVASRAVVTGVALLLLVPDKTIHARARRQRTSVAAAAEQTAQ
jgi:hypothetical protein